MLISLPGGERCNNLYLYKPLDMKKINFLLCAICLFSTVKAQSYLGLHTSNYDAVEGMRYNPALLTSFRRMRNKPIQQATLILPIQVAAC